MNNHLNNLITMKFFFLLSVFLCTFSYSFSQTHVGDIWLNSQTKVDSFGALGYTTFQGHLRIHNTSITDLSSLSELTTVIGKLTVFNNPNLTSLNGLENITKVTDVLSINNNNALTSLDGLSNLDSVEVELKITNNDNLSSILGISNLSYIGQELTIKSNLNLINLDGLNNLNNMSDGRISIEDNLNLNQIHGLENQTNLYSLKLSNNEVLVNLNGLHNIYNLQSLRIINNDALTSLEGLDNLTQSNSIDITTNASLSSLNGLDNLTSAFWIYIYDNAVLADYCALNTFVNNISSTFDFFTATQNLYNPTIEDLIDGICADCTYANPINSTLEALGQSVLITQTNATYQWLNCDSNHAIIPNETSNIFTSNTYGNFAVEITYSGCVDTSECITINTVGISDYQNLNNVTLVPNPTTGIMHLNLDKMYPVQLLVYNALGQLVYSENQISKTFYSFELNAPNGLYYVKVLNENTQKQFKVIKH